MAAIVLPGWSQSPSSSSALTPRATINKTAPEQRRRAIAGEGATIPGAFGRVPVDAKIPTVVRHGSNLLLLCIWLEGEIDGIESVRVGDKTLFSGVTHYLGTAGQTADPWLQAAITGYTDTLPGVAYSVVRLNASQDIEQRIEAVVRGWKVYDPRTEAWVYSTNPALCLAHYIKLRTGREMDWDSVADVANYNDETIGGKKRRELNLLLSSRARDREHIETLRQYAGCYVLWGETVKLIAIKPRAVDFVIGPDKIRDLKLWKRGLDDSPNYVELSYMVEQNGEWKSVTVNTPLPPPGVQLREQRVLLPGILDHAQAQREADQRVATYTLTDLMAEMTMRDEGLQIRAGNLLSITHPYGLENKSMLVVSDPVAVERGRWSMMLEEYSAGVFSDYTGDAPASPDTNLPDPTSVPDGPTPTLTEEVYQLQTGDYATRIRAVWTASSYVYETRYRVEVASGGQLVWSNEGRGTTFVTGALQEGATYTVAVTVIGLGGVTGAAGSAAIVAQGKLLPPGNVPQITARQIDAASARAQWQPAVDVDIYAYELRRGAPGVAWISAILVDQVDGLEKRIDELPVGSHDLLVRALDSVGSYSPTAARVTVTIDPPPAPASLSAFEIGGETRLSWPEADGYIAAYALRYGSTSGDWDSAERLDRVQALRYVTKDIPAGTWRIYIRSVDTAGNLSPDITTTDVTVTLDNSAFLVGAITWSSPTLTGMASWSHRPQNHTPVTYVTDDGSAAATRWSSTMDTYTDPLVTYHDGDPSEWLTESHDVGTEVSGTWQLSGGWQALTGSVDVAIELSTNDIDWDSYSQTSIHATARYARVRISSTDGTLIIKDSQVVLRMSAVPRKESGEVVTSATLPVTVTLDFPYSAVQDLSLAAQGTEALSPVYDNIVLGNPTTFDLYCFDNAGDQVSKTVRWRFEGV